MTALSMACLVDPIFWFLALFSYSRLSLKAHIVPFRLYLTTQLAVSALSVPVIFLLLSSGEAGADVLSRAYTELYFWGAILSGGFAIATIRTLLKRLLAPLAGLQRAALLTFQWLLVVAFLVVLNRMLTHSAHTTLGRQLTIVSEGISLTELVLLLILLPFLFVLRRSLRSHFQDLMMGLAILAISSVVLGIAFHANGTLSSGAAAVAGHVVLVATLIFWISCFAAREKPEPPRMLSLDSRLVRWSETLRALDRESARGE